MSGARIRSQSASSSVLTNVAASEPRTVLSKDSVCIEQQTYSTTHASIEVHLAGHLDEHFRELRVAIDAHFAEQADLLERAAQRQQACLYDCLNKSQHGEQPTQLPFRDDSCPSNLWMVPPEAKSVHQSPLAFEVTSSKRWPRKSSLGWDVGHPRNVRTMISTHTDDLDDHTAKDASPCSSSPGQASSAGRSAPLPDNSMELPSLVSMAPRTRRETTGSLATVILTQWFDQFVGVLIVTNAIFIGAQADWQAKNPSSPYPSWFLIVDSMFAGLFLLELVLKIVVYRSGFFCNPDWRWNLFDMTVVLSGVLELFFEAIDDSKVAADVTYLRIMRVLKLVRVVRIVRVVLVFRELRIMLFSVVATIRSLIWTLISLFGLTFMAGVYITSSVAHHQMILGRDERLTLYFGTLSSTLLCLFQATSGGIDWRDLTDELEKVSWVVVTIFLLYVCLVIYAVMNILTGVCVNQATRAADDDIEFVIQDELSRRNGATNTLRRFFHDADVNNTGIITWQQLREYLRNQQVRAYFKALGIEVWDLRTFFELLRVPGQDQAAIGIDQFVRGCLRLKGHAKSSDLMALRLEIDTLAKASCDMQAGLVREIRHAMMPGGLPESRRDSHVETPKHKSTEWHEEAPKQKPEWLNDAPQPPLLLPARVRELQAL